MKKLHRIFQFEQIIHNIQVAIKLADECDFEEIKDDLEMFLNGLENRYDEFANSEQDVSEVKNEI